MNDIVRMCDLVYHKHAGQVRKSIAIPYALHPFDVVKLLIKWNISDTTTLVVGAGHDLYEDTDVDRQYIVDNFGVRVDELIELLTFRGSDKKKYLDGFADKDIEALVVKVADRVCNIDDFLIDNSDYATCYRNAARSLFEQAIKREKEVENKYGKKTARIVASISGYNLVMPKV